MLEERLSKNILRGELTWLSEVEQDLSCSLFYIIKPYRLLSSEQFMILHQQSNSWNIFINNSLEKTQHLSMR